MAGTVSRPAIPAERYAERLAKAAEMTRARGTDALLLGVGSDLHYLTGYVARPMERLTMLVLAADGRPMLLAPRLEAMPARSSPAGASGAVEVVSWEETEDPVALVARRLGPFVDSIGLSDRLWAMFVLRLQAALPNARFSLATPVLRDLRIRKDHDEIELLRLAAQAADRVIDHIARGRLIGRTEADVAREVSERLVAEGHDEAAFAIVASGPNSASPHHDPGDRVIGAGEPIVLDIGGSLGGYHSDVTRTLWVTGDGAGGNPDPEFLRLYGVLQGAQDESTAAARPGVTAERVDAVARGIIGGAGYGEAFIHRTGHGIGLEGHEDPYIVAGNPEPLEPGMAFSIEPGIYLEGRYGARIEDIVVCGPDGPIVLNEGSRDLRVVQG